MNHELFFDEENDMIVLRVRGDFAMDDAVRCSEFIDKTLKERGSFNVLVDLSEATPSLDKEVRTMLKKQSQEDAVKKFAMVVTHPALRIIGKIATSSMSNSKIFKTEEEALRWLKG
ncbi:STAS/SEC14 domain-containing protein [bacterium]|nr:STAS/SEC14 domain-containing protein [bacterium]